MIEKEKLWAVFSKVVNQSKKGERVELEALDAEFECSITLEDVDRMMDFVDAFQMLSESGMDIDSKSLIEVDLVLKNLRQRLVVRRCDEMAVKTWYEIRREGKCVNLVSNKKTAQYLVSFMKKGEYQIVPVKVVV